MSHFILIAFRDGLKGYAGQHKGELEHTVGLLLFAADQVIELDLQVDDVGGSSR